MQGDFQLSPAYLPKRLSLNCAISEMKPPVLSEKSVNREDKVTSLSCLYHISYAADLGIELKRSIIYNVAIRSQQIRQDSIVFFAPFAALILILTVLLLIKMALYYTLSIVILNKMAVKLDFFLVEG